MTFNAPDTPHKGILRNQEIDAKIPYDLQKRYSSSIGSLTHLVKYLRPELSNTVRELYKCMDKAIMSN